MAQELPPCNYEDSPNCWWDANTMGNGSGESFVNIGDQTFYVTLTENNFITGGSLNEDGTFTLTLGEYWTAPTGETEVIEAQPFTLMWTDPTTPDAIDWVAYLGCDENSSPALDWNYIDGWWGYCEPNEAPPTEEPAPEAPAPAPEAPAPAPVESTVATVQVDQPTLAETGMDDINPAWILIAGLAIVAGIILQIRKPRKG